MAHEELPEDIRLFIDACIDSIEQLSVLILLYSKPERLWTVAEITQELRSSDSSISKRLEDLYSRKVLLRQFGSGGLHKFDPASAEVPELVGKLAEIHQTRPYRLIDAIYSRVPRGVRDFADAFKLKGDKT